MAGGRHRISRGAPLLSTPDQQRTLLRVMESDPDLTRAISTFVGEDITAMPKQHKLAALRSYQNAGAALAPLVMTARLRREAVQEAALRAPVGKKKKGKR